MKLTNQPSSLLSNRDTSNTSLSSNLPPGKRSTPDNHHNHHNHAPQQQQPQQQQPQHNGGTHNTRESSNDTRETPSPEVCPPPVKSQRTDRPPEKPLPPPPEKPLPPPPGGEIKKRSSAENISSILNDTMNEMEVSLSSFLYLVVVKIREFNRIVCRSMFSASVAYGSAWLGTILGGAYQYNKK